MGFAALYASYDSGLPEVRSGEVERLVKDHRVDLRVAPGNKRFALDLIEPFLVQERRHVGVTAVRTRDAELPAVNPADAVLDVELDLAALGHGADCMVDQGIFV